SFLAENILAKSPHCRISGEGVGQGCVALTLQWTCAGYDAARKRACSMVRSFYIVRSFYANPSHGSLPHAPSLEDPPRDSADIYGHCVSRRSGRTVHWAARD